MCSKLRLEVFEPPHESGALLHVSESDLEEARLASFEKGYSAGWEDAVAAQVNETSKQQADLARNLREISFTFDAARDHVLSALEPLLRDMVAKVLPAAARKSVAQIAVDALQPLAAETLEAPILIAVNPLNRAAVEHLLDERAAVRFQVLDEPSLGDCQIHLRRGAAEVHVDLDGVINAIGDAIDVFFKTQDRGPNG